MFDRTYYLSGAYGLCRDVYKRQSEEYLAFLRQNGWTVQKSTVLRASFPLAYTECVKLEG